MSIELVPSGKIDVPEIMVAESVKLPAARTAVIVSTVSNICVLHTAASAGLRWFHVVVPADAIGALTTFGHALTLHQVSSLYNGEVVRSAEHIQFQSS